MSDAPVNPDEVRVLTARIQQTEMARALIDVGKTEEALRILERLWLSYKQPHEATKRRYVEYLIDQVRAEKH